MVSQDLLVYPVAQGPQPHTKPSPTGAPMNLYFLADRICGSLLNLKTSLRKVLISGPRQNLSPGHVRDILIGIHICSCPCHPASYRGIIKNEQDGNRQGVMLLVIRQRSTKKKRFSNMLK